MEKSEFIMDPNSGFCAETKTFHSLRPLVHLPPQHIPLSADAYTFSLRLPSLSHDPLLIDSTTGHCLTYSDFLLRSKNLAAYIRTVIGLSKGDAAFILAPNLIQVPILYFSLLSIGVIICPGNPISSENEISRQIELSKAVIAFAISAGARKLPSLRYRTVLIDSLEFETMMTSPGRELVGVEVSQSDVAAIMYSSGTTGSVKGVMVTHRNLIAMTGSYQRPDRSSPVVLLMAVPYFHVYGFHYVLKSMALNETVIIMERFDLEKMMNSLEKFKATHLAVAPPVVVAMAKRVTTEGRDLSSFECLMSGGAPLGKELIEAFTAKFPDVVLRQAYGMTEVAGSISEALDREESVCWGSSGKLRGIWEAKIVDPETGFALPPLKHGELWVRGPSIMKGYVDDPKATFETLTADGWLKTGDLCYIDELGFIYVVDRLKELIKYKGYQVAPAELEHLLQSHPNILDAAVIPFPDEEAGQIPIAFVVRKPHSDLNQEQVMDFVVKQVAPYKKIRRVSFVNDIPKNASGKILRKELKEISLAKSFPRM